jgi:hypothetical protein
MTDLYTQSRKDLAQVMQDMIKTRENMLGAVPSDQYRLVLEGEIQGIRAVLFVMGEIDTHPFDMEKSILRRIK